MLRSWRFRAHPLRMRSIIVVALLSLGACSKPEARVECRPAGALLAHGYACSVAHVSGSGGEVCWSVDVACANGARSSAHACALITRGATISKAVPFADFGGKLDACDAISTTAISNLSLTP